MKEWGELGAGKVWVTASLDPYGCVQFAGGSDSLLSHGIVAVLASALSGLTPSQLLAMDPHDLLSRLHLSAALTQQPQGSPLPAPLATPQGPGSHARSSRAHAAGNVVESMWRKTRGLVQQLPRFPSLLITPHDLHPQGAFAEAQAEFLKPQPEQLGPAAWPRVLAWWSVDQEVWGVIAEGGPDIHWLAPQVRAVALCVAAKLALQQLCHRPVRARCGCCPVMQRSAVGCAANVAAVVWSSMQCAAGLAAGA
ncbi:SufE domain-containing protein [Haematococcus lacustris]|uniref:SufE domain-containing protein n=1 Tax=Haematococcus lacustris TaxID=44745 RepID=A0A699Z9R1_HAELA|nr:SufE domain-containing protein [Haematococcus lacustris]